MLGKESEEKDFAKINRVLAKPHVRANKTSAQSIPNATSPFTTIIFNSEEYDDDDEYNPATGVFTAKRGGRLAVKAGMMYQASTAWGATDQAILSVYVNGVRKADIGREFDFSGANIFVALEGCATTVQVSEGQTVTVRAFQSSGSARAMNTSAVSNYVTFDWLP